MDFKTAFTFGDKVTELVLESDICQSIKENLQNATNYSEGKTIQIDVKDELDLSSILKLIQLKLS